MEASFPATGSTVVVITPVDRMKVRNDTLEYPTRSCFTVEFLSSGLRIQDRSALYDAILYPVLLVPGGEEDHSLEGVLLDNSHESASYGHVKAAEKVRAEAFGICGPALPGQRQV